MLSCSIYILSSRNRLLPATDHRLVVDAFKSLTELQLNGTLMTWFEMQTAIAGMPNLRLVEMGYNKLATLSTTDNSFPDNKVLQVINLDSNTCSDWVHVCKSLHQYPSYVVSFAPGYLHSLLRRGWSVSS
jgi:tubulin-specific chaperone E